ncbi:RNA polymerase II-associated, Paf1 [Purpureocillium lilacinum]|nr:RNA polymerase II-associated, Paf1 [Purpureocillium lilacinum]OAQ84635.1 RNA polymerase II-associated, Paf1 [Purpureocillium lilacinum]OAQ89176.1 RNA polymerase II-associated, Paf1 [Purpureocillium lilacinum]GJN68902.1 hypothetical protein PLICBS_002947 [Purpureocillium lilacinum]GJN77420.1 hypothetical protein PLIIFM63780_000911 [Purpureocillium lilacinum]
MASTGARTGERVVHQDYIARIRFSNALPPPPTPPKLLDIPNTGLASGQYTTPGFASRLAREQPLNIEADAELGMPLNLVGMPGVFDGDERSIQAPAVAPPVHPHDRALLRPIAALGKPKVAEANVSFLRRTEYISSSTPKRPEGNNARALLARARKPARPAPDAAADSPAAIKRKIDRSFEVAEADLKDTKRVKHPTKKNLKLVDAVPLLPDLDAFPDSGAYVTIKFLTNPITNATQYDTRLLSGLFRPIDRTPAEEAMFEAALAAYEQDPVNNPKPQNLMNYDFYLAPTKDVAKNFRRKFDLDDPEHDSDDLYTHGTGSGRGHFAFNRVRAYETAQETELDHPTKYEDEIILASNDDDTYPKQKAVYYYPIMQRSFIRPQRTKRLARTAGMSQDDDEEQVIDQIEVTVQDPSERMLEAMRKYKERPLGWDQGAEDEEEEQTQTQTQDADADADADADENQDSDAEQRRRRHRESSEVDRADDRSPQDRDGEGEEDEDEDED